MKDRSIAVVAEGDAAKADSAPHRLLEVVGARPFLDRRLLVEHAEQLRQRGHGRLEQVVHVGQVDQRLKEPVEVEKERHHGAEGQGPVEHPQPADDKHGNDRSHAKESNDREVPGDGTRRRHVCLVVGLVDPAE